MVPANSTVVYNDIWKVEKLLLAPHVMGGMIATCPMPTETLRSTE